MFGRGRKKGEQKSKLLVRIMKGRQKILSVVIFFGILCCFGISTKAATSSTVSVFHVHGDSCGYNTNLVWQNSNYGGNSVSQSRGPDCSCGGYVDTYAFYSKCSCGKEWSDTGHACVNSAYGSNNGSCTNYEALSTDTWHQHPVKTYACGLDETSVVSQLFISTSTDNPSKEVVLVGNVSNPENIVNLSYSWSNGASGDSVIISENGTYTLTVSGDNIQTTGVSISILNVDSVSPTINSFIADVTIPTSGDVTLSVSATDSSGLATEPYSWDGATWSSDNTKRITANGTYTVYVRDSVGNVANASISVNNIDRTAPDISLFANKAEATTENVILNVIATDSSGLASEPYSWDGTNWGNVDTKTITENGVYKVFVKDALGNVGNASISVSNIDRKGPDITLEADEKNYTAEDITLSVSATDPSGLATKPYSWDGTTWSNSNSKKISENGTYKVYVKDALGNVSNASISVNNIDRKAPDITLEADEKNVTAEDVMLSVVATDSSGLAVKPYSWDGTTWSNSNIKKISENGTYKVYVKDAVGNIGDTSITVNNIDCLKPDITLKPDKTEPTSEGVIVKVEATDNYGLATNPYSWDAQTWSNHDELTVTANGIYTVYVKDRAGNIANQSIEIGNIDTTVPKVILEADMTALTAGDVIVRIKAEDTSGLAMKPYSTDRETWWETNTLTITMNGIYTVFVKDAVGNVANASIEIHNIDKTAPYILLETDVKEPTTGKVIISVDANDTSGLATEPYSWDGITWSNQNTQAVTMNGTYVVYVRDSLGNVASENITVSNIFVPDSVDREPPIIKGLYKNTDAPSEEVIITVEVEEPNVLISWDGGVTWGNETATVARANTMHTVLVKDMAGNTASASIEISNIMLPEIIEEPSITEEISEEVTEDVSEEPVKEVFQEPEEPASEESDIVLEPVVMEISVKQEKIRFAGLFTVAVPVGGGGFIFFFFGFWLLRKNATLYARDGLKEKKIGKIKIKKKSGTFTVKIPETMLRRASSNQLLLVPSKGFLKKNEGMYVNIQMNAGEVGSRIEKEIRIEG